MIPVVFENSDFVVLDKPAGISFHSETEPGLVVLAQTQLGCDLYPVHRLDKMTSGLILMAKTSDGASRFHTLFEAKQIEKYYLALSTHKPKKKQGWIKGDMVPARRGDWRLTATLQKPAITQFISASIEPNLRAFLVKPHTGKTHQIRVALKSLGSPIAGDLRYQAADKAKQEDRGYLHAFALRFEYQQQMYAFELPPTFGERFLTQAFQLQCTLWQTPWKQF
jgi:tRNA pseudouridine32 synthase/23S rRNA pseudouridine746 synthase